MNEARAGLYVHVPFCSSICPYCDFAVTTGRLERDGPRFVDAVLTELARSEFPFDFDTIYLGGGTPSWLEGELGRLVGGLRADGRVRDDAGFHVEANPEDVTEAAAAAWGELDVAFLSLGVQSFDDEALAALGRAHDGAAARLAIARCRAAGIPTVSVDVIFGLPGQAPVDVTQALDEVARSGARHLSCYQLTIHEGTPFHRFRERGELSELDDEDQGRLFEHVHTEARRLGFEAYEVSNFAAGAEHRSRHNSKYWSGDPYLGIGPSAHSFDGRERWWNARAFHAWAGLVDDGASPIAERERLDDEQLATERLMLGLRTADGVDLARIEAELGLRPTLPSRARIDSWLERGLATRGNSRVRLTRRGWAVTDALAAEIELEAVR